MRFDDIALSVGKREIDDKKKVNISGRLISPDTKTDILLLLSTGLGGKHPDYYTHFGKLLGEEFNVYITEHRRRGISKGSTLKRDFSQIDDQIRDRVETDQVIYIGHSMGTAIANTCAEEYGKEVISLYGICAYPRFSDSRVNSVSLTKIVSNYLEKSEFGPFIPLTNGHKLVTPAKMAIGGNDHVLRTYDTEVVKGFLQKFEQYNAEVEVFDGMNHCFNSKPYDLAPFNKIKPVVLVDNIKEFVYKSLSYSVESQNAK